MALIEVNWKPTSRQLRQFGVTCLVALPAIAWLWNASLSAVAMLAAIGALLAIVGAAAPQLLRPVFVAASLVAAPVGLVVGETIMLIVYYGVVTPIGLLGRLVGRDPLQLGLDKDAQSYWQPKEQPRSVDSYFRRY